MKRRAFLLGAAALPLSPALALAAPKSAADDGARVMSAMQDMLREAVERMINPPVLIVTGPDPRLVLQDMLPREWRKA